MNELRNESEMTLEIMSGVSGEFETKQYIKNTIDFLVERIQRGNPEEIKLVKKALKMLISHQWPDDLVENKLKYYYMGGGIIRFDDAVKIFADRRVTCKAKPLKTDEVVQLGKFAEMALEYLRKGYRVKFALPKMERQQEQEQEQEQELPAFQKAV